MINRIFPDQAGDELNDEPDEPRENPGIPPTKHLDDATHKAATLGIWDVLGNKGYDVWAYRGSLYGSHHVNGKVINFRVEILGEYSNEIRLDLD